MELFRVMNDGVVARSEVDEVDPGNKRLRSRSDGMHGLVCG